MSKTKELIIKCDEATIKPSGYVVRVVVDSPDIDDLVSQLDWDDLVAHVQSESQNKPGLVFDDEYLEKWAEENGYIKA